MSRGEKYGDRLFRADNPARELPRLTALSAMHDPDTFRVLSAVGVKPGWSVLDVGPGAGVTTRWLAGEVGRGGWRDDMTALLPERDLDVLEVVRSVHDDLDLPEGYRAETVAVPLPDDTTACIDTSAF